VSKVYFVGMGPGCFELLTLKAYQLLKEADTVLYPGSLSNPELIERLKEENPSAEFVDTYGLKLEQIIEVLRQRVLKGKKVVRLVSGDPAFFSAIQEQVERLRELGIEYEVVPGVSSAVAGSARLGIELTYPELSNTVIFTRIQGKTGGATPEEIKAFARTRSTLVFFLSAGRAREIKRILSSVLPSNTPVAILHAICRKEENLILTELKQLDEVMEKHGIKKTALILVGKVVSLVEKSLGKRSKLYG